MKKCEGPCTYYRQKDFTKEEVKRKNLLYVEAVIKCRNVCKYCGDSVNYRERRKIVSFKKFRSKQ